MTSNLAILIANESTVSINDTEHDHKQNPSPKP